MALVYDGMPCALCGAPLDPENCFATTHFLDQAHPLAQYSDAAMHWSCYDAWPSRQSFARAYFEAWVNEQALSAHWGLVYQSERVAVAMSAPPNEMVRVAVASTIAGLQIELARWEHLLDERMDLPHLRRVDRSAVVDVLGELREALPDASTVRNRLDVKALKARQDCSRSFDAPDEE